MKRLLISFVFVGLFICLAGCIEEKSEYHISPDGSGKVIYETIETPLNLFIGAGRSDGQGQLEEFVQEILSKSVGVDTWKAVSFKQLDDGKFYFKGTAYC